MTPDLSEKEVRERLASYEDGKITDELYSFGQLMLHDAIERLNKLDTKAAAFSGYAGGVIAILVSTAKTWAAVEPRWHILIPLGAVGAFFFAALSGVQSMFLTKTEWLSPNEWMNKDCLGSIERLRRYHVLAMWGAQQSLDDSYAKKTGKIRLAGNLTLAAWILLVAALFDIAWRHAAF